MAMLVMATVLALPAPGAPAQEISAALRDRVDLLVERLGSGDGDEAARAEASLIELGPRVLPALPGEDAELPEGVGARLDRVREALREAQEAGKNLDASRVTITGEGLRLSEVLRELQSQSGNPITDLRAAYGQEVTNPALDLEIEDLPFLEAIDLVAEQAGLSLEFFTGDASIGVLAGGGEMGYAMGTDPGQAPVIYTGPFRVTPDQIAAQRDLRSGTGSANLRMTVVWEPRLKPMLLKLEASDIEIIDDRGEPVPPAVPEEAGDVVLRPENPIAEMNLNMELPDRAAGSLATVSVRADVTVPAADTVFRLDLAEEGARQEQGEVALELRGVRADGFVWKVNVAITYDGASEAFETYRQGLFNNEIWLQAADGSRFEQNGGFNQLGGSGNSLVFQYLFVDAPGEPSDYTLVYKTPGAVEAIPLEFTFEDIPLP